MAFGFAGAAKGATDALTEMLVAAQMQKQREAEMVLRQQADARANKQMAMQEAEATAAAEARAMQRTNTRAKIALDTTAPNAELDPQMADLIGQSDYAPMVQSSQTLPSRSAVSTDNPQWTENAPRRYAFRKATSAEQDGINQTAQRRTISDLFKRGAHRNDIIGAMADAGENVSAAMLNGDPAEAAAARAEADRQFRAEQSGKDREMRAQLAGVAASGRGGNQDLQREILQQRIDATNEKRDTATQQQGLAKQSAQAATQNALDLIKQLADVGPDGKVALKGATQNLFGLRVPEMLTMSGTDTATARADLKRLTSRSILDLMNEMKAQSRTGATGFGALTGPELAILEQASTTLNNPGISDTAARDELQRLYDTALRLKNGGAVPTQTPAGQQGGSFRVIRKVP